VSRGKGGPRKGKTDEKQSARYVREGERIHTPVRFEFPDFMAALLVTTPRS